MYSELKYYSARPSVVTAFLGRQPWRTSAGCVVETGLLVPGWTDFLTHPSLPPVIMTSSSYQKEQLMCLWRKSGLPIIISVKLNINLSINLSFIYLRAIKVGDSYLNYILEHWTYYLIYIYVHDLKTYSIILLSCDCICKFH